MSVGQRVLKRLGLQRLLISAAVGFSVFGVAVGT